jgi:putative phage-type endonuclease
MRVILGIQQQTDAWLKARSGLITASRMCDVMARRKRGEGEMACRKAYRMELVSERLSGRAEDHYVSPEMEHGTDTEPFARAAYEVTEGVMVDIVGLVLHPAIDFSAASPDGVIDEDGCVEFKCPKTATHLEWKLAGVVPEEHVDQCMWVMACCERQWCDFISYDPRLPQGLRFFLKRLPRDEKRIAEMEYEVIQFNYEIEEMCKRLGGPVWVPQLPAGTQAQASGETARIGACDVPADIVDLIDRAEMVP